ncbi:TonB-dependent receptor [Chitinophaga sp.]|uniref:SusC/RagA family TonB-linked outer membrane protein n=1 Tax=Chitinophaga sp. TaxID=1869181 RepID=UPI0026317B14|nr:TonB-dependent receptor [uncultured Chitinophaga sp.]
MNDIALQKVATVRRSKLMLLLLLCLSWAGAYAQTAGPQKVSGFVRDSAGSPLPQVTVYEKGTRNGTLSQPDGQFTINVKPGAILVFTMVGFRTQELAATPGAAMNVALLSSATELTDVVIVGYGAARKKSLTNAISSVSAQDIGNVRGGATVSTTLAGKVPGVSFRMPDGRPGASASIQIRNLGRPLYVIDGVQQDEGQFNNISPNDIESISFLKDASAAIYGVRAANGVVVVQTKRGRIGSRSSINLDANWGWQSWTRFIDVLDNSHQYMSLKAEAEMNRFPNIGDNPITTNITPEELEKYRQGTEYGYKSFKWRDYIVKENTPLNQYNLNFTGGTDKVTYYVSATRTFQNSVLGREYKFTRTNIQSNVSARVANGLRVGTSINGRVETRDNPGVPGVDDYWQARFAILRNTPMERPFANDNPAYLNDIKHNETNWGYLNTQYAGKFKSDWRQLQMNLDAEWDVPFVEGLKISGLYSYYMADNVLNNHEYTYDTYTYNPSNDTYTRTGGSTNPWRERNQEKQINQSSQIRIGYERKFGDHKINAMVVSERINNHRLRNWIHAVPISNQLPLIYFNTSDTYTDQDNRQTRTGIAGRLNYEYGNKYFIEGLMRRDASYLFAPGKRVGYFPSVSGAWRLTEENFMKKVVGTGKILSDFKIRGSYGILGDDGEALGLAEFAYYEGYNYNDGIAILDGVAVVGARDRGVPITNISWLESSITNVGFDFSMLGGRLNGAFDYFVRKRNGLRGRKQDILLPSELGYALPDENINKDKRFGQDFSISYNDKAGKLSYRIGGNISYSRGQFISSYNPLFFNSVDRYFNSAEGRLQGFTWGWEAIGQFKTQEEINSYPVNIDGKGNRSLLPGDIIYKDVDGDGRITDNDRRPMGWASGQQPNMNFGLQLGLGYEGFDFVADFSGASHYTWIQEWEMKVPFINDGNLNKVFTDRWHRSDIYDRNSQWNAGKYPALRYNDQGHSNNRASTFWNHNVTYFRARTIELGYTLPTPLVNRARIQKARFYVNAYNLFILDNMKEYSTDPEITDTNGLQYPQSKVFNVGCSLSF